MKRVTHGDEQLASYAVRDRDDRHFKILANTMALVWDSYGLANGRLNPTSRHYRRPGDSFHATMAPSLKMINAAMNELLIDILDPSDQWMLEIPRVFNTGRITSDLILSPTGGAAILMPMAAFGTLFLWNEILMISNNYAAKTGLREVPPNERKTKLVSYLFTGGELPSGVAEADVNGFLMMLDMYRLIPDENSCSTQIWEYTIFQQALMILHEFGHVKLRNMELEALSEDSPFPPWDRFADEMAVDHWSAKWLCKLADSLLGYLPNGRRLASDALWYFFVLQDIVNDVNGQPLDKRELCIRFIYLMNDLGALDDYQEFGKRFDGIARTVGGRRRRNFILFEQASLVNYAKRLLKSRRKALRAPPQGVTVPDFFNGARISLGMTLGK
jgi:hypothetical protein